MEFLSESLYEKVEDFRNALLNEVRSEIENKIESYGNATVTAYTVEGEEHKIRWDDAHDAILNRVNEAFLELVKSKLAGVPYTVVIFKGTLYDIFFSGLFKGLSIDSVRVPKPDDEDYKQNFGKVYAYFTVDTTVDSAFVRYWQYMTEDALKAMKQEELVVLPSNNKPFTNRTKKVILDTLLLVHAIYTNPELGDIGTDIVSFPIVRAESVLYTLKKLSSKVGFIYEVFTFPEVVMESIRETFGDKAKRVTIKTLGTCIINELPDDEAEYNKLRKDLGIAIEFNFWS